MMRLTSCAVVLCVALGCRENKAQQIPPTLSVDVKTYDFGVVRVDTTQKLTVPVTAANGADVVISSMTVEGSSAITLDAPPSMIRGRTTEDVVLTFAPTAAMAEAATLVIRSNDEAAPELRLPLTGRGAYPQVAIELGCDTTTHCEAIVSASPPAITFAPEPFVRLRPLTAPELPQLTVRSIGEVPAVLNGLALGGIDVTAFSFVGNAALPDGGIVLLPGETATVPLRFRPTSDTQTTYAGELTVNTDDPTALAVNVPLSGALRPNFAPTVCTNIVKVTAPGLPAHDYDWADVSLDGGALDVSSIRDVPPRAEVVLSALSSEDETTCTADPEDGRLGLTWAWTLLAQPAGSTPATLVNAATPRPSLRPYATGSYTAQLSVTDSQGNVGVSTLTFEVAVKNDLVAQLDWTGSANVDLDLHLVRPGAAPFASFAEPDAGSVSGDMNGYAATSRSDGGTFDWGFTGALDDPQLNFDDTGTGPLLENISLNGPEDADDCATSACTYAVYVHAFRDSRSAASATPCFIDGGVGCLDGETCDCPSGLACVANAAPANVAPSGAGRCLANVPASVRVFLRGSATPAITVPIVVGAPCEMIHAADITWPARGSDGAITVVSAGGIERYGVRGNNSLQCAPDGPQAGVPWYRAQPR